jgi:hypothetical protein
LTKGISSNENASIHQKKQLPESRDSPSDGEEIFSKQRINVQKIKELKN